MGAPTTTGIGQGEAQVFNTQNIVNTFFRLRQERAIQEQRDQQQVTTLMGRMQPGSIRAADLPEYNKLYNDVKGIYFKNKDLYRNPVKYPDQLQAVNDKVAAMKQLAAESKDQAQVGTTVGKAYLQNQDKFEDGTAQTLDVLHNQPVSKIKELNGGKLFSIEDFAFKPKPIDFKKIASDIHDFARGTQGGVSTVVESKTHADDPGVPEGNVMVTKHEVFNPTVIGAGVEHKWETDSNFRKSYTDLYSKSKPEDIQKTQDELDKTYHNGGFKIQTAADLAKADIILHFGSVSAGPPMMGIDKAYAEKQRDINKADAFARSLQLQGNMFAHQDKMLSERAALRASTKKADDDKLLESSRTINKTLSTGSGKDVQTALKPLIKYGLRPELVPLNKGYETFKANLSYANSHAFDPNDKVDPAAFKKLYEKGVNVMLVKRPKTDGSGNPIVIDGKPQVEYLIHDPTRFGADEHLYGRLKKMGAAVKKGVYQNEDIPDAMDGE